MEICPLPLVWNAIYERLLKASRERLFPPPPVPLILGAWWFTSDFEKQEQWRATLDWAERHGFSDLIGPLTAVLMYCVDKPTSYKIGALGPQCTDPKRKPSSAERKHTLKRLEENWDDIAGPDLAAATRPKRLTGRKGRRLLVAARIDVRPPWGTWTMLPTDERRRHFTRFRGAINARAAPAEIDHVDFVDTATDS